MQRYTCASAITADRITSHGAAVRCLDLYATVCGRFDSASTSAAARRTWQAAKARPRYHSFMKTDRPCMRARAPDARLLTISTCNGSSALADARIVHLMMTGRGGWPSQLQPLSQKCFGWSGDSNSESQPVETFTLACSRHGHAPPPIPAPLLPSAQSHDACKVGTGAPRIRAGTRLRATRAA